MKWKEKEMKSSKFLVFLLMVLAGVAQRAKADDCVKLVEVGASSVAAILECSCKVSFILTLYTSPGSVECPGMLNYPAHSKCGSDKAIRECTPNKDLPVTFTGPICDTEPGSPLVDITVTIGKVPVGIKIPKCKPKCGGVEVQKTKYTVKDYKAGKICGVLTGISSSVTSTSAGGVLTGGGSSQ